MTQQAIVLLGYQGTTFTTSLVQDYLEAGFTYDGEEFPFAIALIDTSEPDFIPKQGIKTQIRF